MAALSPRARALVQAGRSAFRPEAADRARIDAALAARLGPAAFPPDAPKTPTAAPPPGTVGWPLLTRLAIGVLAVGGAAFLALHPGVRSPAPTAPHAAPAATSAVAAPVASDLPNPTEPTVSPGVSQSSPPADAVGAPSSEAPSSTPPRARDRLAEEVALLSRATTALRAGRAGEALKALDEHQRRFPGGVLTEERRGAKAQALCTSKRVTEGRAELARLAPNSPAAARARQVCDSIAATIERK